MLTYFKSQLDNLGHSRQFTFLEKVNFPNGSHMMVVKTIGLWKVGALIETHRFVNYSHKLPIFEKVET